MEKTLTLCRSFEAAADEDLRQWLTLSGRERMMIGESMRGEAVLQKGEAEKGTRVSN